MMIALALRKGETKTHSRIRDMKHLRSIAPIFLYLAGGLGMTYMATCLHDAQAGRSMMCLNCGDFVGVPFVTLHRSFWPHPSKQTVNWSGVIANTLLFACLIRLIIAWIAGAAAAEERRWRRRTHRLSHLT